MSENYAGFLVATVFEALTGCYKSVQCSPGQGMITMMSEKMKISADSDGYRYRAVGRASLSRPKVYMGDCHHLDNQRFEFDLPRYAGRTIRLPAASLDSVRCWFSAYRIMVMTCHDVTGGR